MSRIGIRILIGQYLELHREPQLFGYVGLINRSTSPADIFAQVIPSLPLGGVTNRVGDPVGWRCHVIAMQWCVRLERYAIISAEL